MICSNFRNNLILTSLIQLKTVMKSCKLATRTYKIMFFYYTYIYVFIYVFIIIYIYMYIYLYFYMYLLLYIYVFEWSEGFLFPVSVCNREKKKMHRITCAIMLLKALHPHNVYLLHAKVIVFQNLIRTESVSVSRKDPTGWWNGFFSISGIHNNC